MKSPCLGCSRRTEDKNQCVKNCEKLSAFQAYLRGKVASDDVYERSMVIPRPEFPTFSAGFAI